MIDTGRFVVEPGSTVDLSENPSDDTGDFQGGKKEGRKAATALSGRLEKLQELLWAEHRRRILIVLQAMDTGGKDGVIRSVFEGVNPQGVRVASFKRPTEPELSHDYLWRVHRHTPADGEMVIFNRSHYEDVLVVRVHDLVSEGRWSRRYDQINDFEQMLTDEGTTILKFFLHISKEEQKARLQARLDDPRKHWKFSHGDLAEREHWDEYQAAYADALSKTSTTGAPWIIVPADRKWFRDLVVSTVIVQTLEGLQMKLPESAETLDGVVVT